MIEEIQLLLPLLDNVTGGAFWLIIIFFVASIVKPLLVIALVAFIGFKIANLAFKFKNQSLSTLCASDSIADKVYGLLIAYRSDGSDYLYYSDVEQLEKDLKNDELT